MNIFLACRPELPTWEVLGVYSTAELAEKRCTKEGDFVGPLPVDQDLPEECTDWHGAYYPEKR